MNPKIIAAACLLAFAPVSYAQDYEFEFYKNHIYLNLSVNGVPAKMVFDTGSASVYLDSTWFAGSGLKFDQMGNAMISGAGKDRQWVRMVMSGVEMSFGEKKVHPAMVPLTDLRAILGEKVDGLFGTPHLIGKVIAIDYQRGRLSVREKLTPGMTEGYSRVPITIDPAHPGQILFPVEVTVNSGLTIKGKAFLDTGSGQGIGFTSKTAVKYHLDKLEDKKAYHLEHGGVGGADSGYDITIQSVRIGDIVTAVEKCHYSTNKTGAMASDACIAIVGNELWKHFSVILDLNGKNLYLKKNL